MSGNNLFGNEQDNNQQQDVSGEDALKLLVGEGCKYATAEDLAKAMVHSQQHISTIEQENATFKQQAEKSANIEEVLAAIKAQQSGNDAGANDVSQDPAQDTPQPKQEPVDVDARVLELLNQRDAQSKAEQNRNKVTDALAQKLGDNAAKAYRDAGKRLGVDLDKLAEQSPDAVISLVAGTTTPRTDSPASQGSVSTGRSSSPQQSNAMSYKSIQDQYANGHINRSQKHKLEFDGLQQLGDDFWK